MRSWSLEWDRDYGIDKRRGWTIVYNGSIIAELERYLVVAVWKALRNVRKWELRRSHRSHTRVTS